MHGGRTRADEAFPTRIDAGNCPASRHLICHDAAPVPSERMIAVDSRLTLDDRLSWTRTPGWGVKVTDPLASTPPLPKRTVSTAGSPTNGGLGSMEAVMPLEPTRVRLVVRFFVSSAARKNTSGALWARSGGR